MTNDYSNLGPLSANKGQPTSLKAPFFGVGIIATLAVTTWLVNEANINGASAMDFHGPVALLFNAAVLISFATVGLGLAGFFMVIFPDSKIAQRPEFFYGTFFISCVGLLGAALDPDQFDWTITVHVAAVLFAWINPYRLAIYQIKMWGYPKGTTRRPRNTPNTDPPEGSIP